MAGTTVEVTRQFSLVDGDFFFELYKGYNLVITDLATLRASGAVETILIPVEDLGAGSDIAARPALVAPAALTVTSVLVLPYANSAGVDAGNSVVLTLRNITEGVDVATVTVTADFVSGTPITVTITGANADVAASDVLGITVTQGATANTAGFAFQVSFVRQALDAAGDLVAPALSTRETGD